MSDAPAPARATLRFESFAPRHVPAVRAFNARLDAAGVFEGYRLGETPIATPAGEVPYPVHREILLAMEGEEVRGSILLLHQAFELDGAPQRVTNVQLPLSEGIVDKRWAHVGMWMLRTVLREHPNAFAVGMGGMEQPLPKLLRALGWYVRPVPFFFRVHRASRFLRGMPLLRRDRLRRLVGTAGAVTGAGWLGLRALEQRAAWRAGATRGAALEATEIDGWDDWADDVWTAARTQYDLIATRDRVALEQLYPASGDRYRCYRLSAGGAAVGWVVLLRKEMRSSPAFGDLTVGTLLDCLARPGHEAAVARAARRLLVALDVDLAVSNQNHVAWRRALGAAGFLGGPSNYLIATSKALAQTLAASGDAELLKVHLTRGDGDGRLQL